MVHVSIGRMGAGLAIHYYFGVHMTPRRIERDESKAENMVREGLGTSLT